MNWLRSEEQITGSGRDSWGVVRWKTGKGNSTRRDNRAARTSWKPKPYETNHDLSITSRKMQTSNRFIAKVFDRITEVDLEWDSTEIGSYNDNIIDTNAESKWVLSEGWPSILVICIDWMNVRVTTRVDAAVRMHSTFNHLQVFFVVERFVGLSTDCGEVIGFCPGLVDHNICSNGIFLVFLNLYVLVLTGSGGLVVGIRVESTLEVFGIGCRGVNVP